MKPSCEQAMQQLIAQIRSTLPFASPLASLCDGPCQGCPKKLMEYLDDQLCYWQAELAAGNTPRLGDVHRLARQSRKIYRVLEQNGWLAKARALRERAA